MKSADKRLMFRVALNVYAPSLLETVSDEHRFFKPRRWRFDFAWPARMVAVEIDGGRWAPVGPSDPEPSEISFLWLPRRSRP